MARYLTRRIVSMILALWLIITLTFVIMHKVPGGPFASEKAVPESIKRNLESRYRLDAPLHRQYIDYLSNLARFDLGPSYKYEHRSVNDIIRSGFPVSASLGALAVLFALLAGITTGVISALRKNCWQDHLAMLLSTLGYSVPSFILAGLLVYLFSYKANLLPPAMWGAWQQAILPSLALAALPTAFIARLTRSEMLEALQQDYIKTARAKGLSESAVVWRHALRNAALPVVTYIGPLIATVFTGSFVIETFFAVPGLGKWFVTSILNRDYTVILGLTIFYSSFLMLMNLLADLVYAVLDPRLRLTEGKEV